MASDRIEHLHAVEVLDSRGIPTPTVTVTLANGTTGTGTVPGGTSAGSHEATELRDGDAHRYFGKGVKNAVASVNTRLSKDLKGMAATDQRAVDVRMIHSDGTANKSDIGANAILGVSLAVAQAAAQVQGLPLFQHLREHFAIKEKSYYLPTPLMNVFNGGSHADTNLDLQEFWIVPIASDRFAERVRCGSEIFQTLGAVLREQGLDTDVGNEGGYAPRVKSNAAPLELITEAIRRSPYTAGEHVVLGMDAAATEFFNTEKQTYDLTLEGKSLTAAQLNDWYAQLVRQYPIALLEDPMAEDDWDGWKRVTDTWGKDLRIIGDDVFVTNPERLRMGFAKGAANSILIKPNQIGTVTETIDTVLLAKRHNYQVALSHRSGETNDTAVADLAVAVNADFLKAGAPNRGERVAKYNRIMVIEDELSKE